MNHLSFLDIAEEEANNAKALGELPAGAVLVKDNQIVARSHTRCHTLNDPIAVPEMDCIRQAGRRLDQPTLTLYSSRYPDMLSAGTILQFSIGKVVIGLPEKRNDAINLLRSKNVPVRFEPHDGCIRLEAIHV